MSVRNECWPIDPVPDEFFLSADPQAINNHLSRFVVETRKSKGDHYPPATFHQRHMRSKNSGCPNSLDKKDSHFRQLHGTLDSYFHKLHSDGVGKQIKHAEVISSEEEDQLWEKEWWTLQHIQGYKMLPSLLLGKCFVYMEVRAQTITVVTAETPWRQVRMSTMKMFQRIQMVVLNNSQVISIVIHTKIKA